jgi:hypothetical protein
MPEPSRLRLPAGYGEFEPFTFESAPTWDDVDPKLEFSRNYWLSVRDDCGPHTVPVWGIWSDLAFTFSTDPASRKGRAIALGSPCQIHLESADDVVIVVGRVEPLPADQLLPFLAAYEKKYGVLIDPSDLSTAIYRLIPDTAMTWIERDFQRTAARWDF